jgi:hypothetical protein
MMMTLNYILMKKTRVKDVGRKIGEQLAEKLIVSNSVCVTLIVYIMVMMMYSNENSNSTCLGE